MGGGVSPLRPLAILMKTSARLLPIRLKVMIRATPIKLAVKPYSIAVAPSSSRQNRIKKGKNLQVKKAILNG
jgi:hypothetical protein